MGTLSRAPLLAALLAFSASPAFAQETYPERVGPPTAMAGLGDSITRGFNVNTFGSRPSLSWSTGNDPTVTSHFRQLVALGSTPAAYNFAVVGADMADLNAQVSNAVSQRTATGGTIDYVTLLMGANDACRSSEETMTAVADYRARFEAALEALSSGLPDARIFVASIPDVYVLWEVLHTNETAVQAWNDFLICQSMLANPTSMEAADVERRARVRQRVVDFNQQLAEVCGGYIHCRYDQGGVYARQFAAVDVSTIDYFHPSLAGQNRLGSESWPSTFDFTDAVAPVSTWTVEANGNEDLVTLSATDNVAVRGHEYRREGDTGWTRYDEPVALPDGETLIFRAVDVNGNIEGSRSFQRGDPIPDGGPAQADAGSDTSDGGSLDGGFVDEPSSPGGCSCAAGGALPTALFGLLALLRLRRRAA